MHVDDNMGGKRNACLSTRQRPNAGLGEMRYVNAQTIEDGETIRRAGAGGQSEWENSLARKRKTLRGSEGQKEGEAEVVKG